MGLLAALHRQHQRIRLGHDVQLLHGNPQPLQQLRVLRQHRIIVENLIGTLLQRSPFRLLAAHEVIAQELDVMKIPLPGRDGLIVIPAVGHPAAEALVPHHALYHGTFFLIPAPHRLAELPAQLVVIAVRHIACNHLPGLLQRHGCLHQLVVGHAGTVLFHLVQQYILQAAALQIPAHRLYFFQFLVFHSKSVHYFC